MKKKRPAALGTNVVHPNVSRVDYAGNHGYTVRLQRNGKESNKLFSDGIFGSQRKARLAAIAWREEMVRKLGPASPNAKRAGVIKPPGYSYIKRGVGYHYVGDFRYEYPAWVGFLRIEDRKHLVTKWAIDKWGNKEAHRRCEAWLFKRKAELAFRLARAKAGGAKKTALQRELRA